MLQKVANAVVIKLCGKMVMATGLFILNPLQSIQQMLQQILALIQAVTGMWIVGITALSPRQLT